MSRTPCHRLHRRPPRALGVALAAAALLGACATTHVDTVGSPAMEPLCQRGNESLQAMVVWSAHWRADQKEPQLREAAARKGIERFFAESGCFASARVVESTDRPAPLGRLTPAQVRDMAAPAQRAVFVTVRELGPVLKLLSSLALVDGGTEVVLDLKVVATHTGETLGDFRTHWQNGGPWVFKGVAGLEEDMVSALRGAMRPASANRP